MFYLGATAYVFYCAYYKTMIAWKDSDRPEKIQLLNNHFYNCVLQSNFTC